jgi:hypothetical protein
MVGRRDCTKLVDGVLHQIELVRGVVGDAPVAGAMCFIDADWPLVGGSFTTKGVQVLGSKKLLKQLSAATGAIEVAEMRDRLAAHFPLA